MNEEAILNALQAIAFSDYTDYIWIEDGQVRVKDTRLLRPEQRAAIAGIKDSGKGVELKLHDKQKALELLVKYLGFFEHPAEEATVRVELKLHDKQKALELLVKYLGFFEHPAEEATVRVELSGIPEDWAE